MKDKIFSACDTLQAQGVKPTLERVREKLGGGSFSSINPILKEWKEQQIRGGSRVAIELPAEALEAINQATQLIWKLAVDKNAELTHAMKQEFDGWLKEAVAEKEEALAEVSRLEQSAAKLTADHEKLTKENHALTLQVQKQQLALDVCEKQNAELKADHKAYQEELKGAISEAAMLKGQLVVYEKMKAK